MKVFGGFGGFRVLFFAPGIRKELSAADLNHDGVCNVLDLVKLKRMLLEG